MSAAVRGLLAVTGCALALAAAVGQTVPTAAPAAAEARAYSVIYLAERRPLQVQMHVSLDGKPLEAAWEEDLREMFRFFDRDGDGTLDRAEAARLPSAQQVRMMRQSGYTYGVGGAATFATLAEMDLDEDGKVTLAELVQYHRSKEIRGLQFQLGPLGPAGGSPATRALLRLLDANGDGKLSREELARAPEALGALDGDEDELVSVRELVQGQAPVAVLAAGPGMMAAPAAAKEQPARVLLVPPIDVPNRLALWMDLVQQVIGHYDRDRSGSLSRREIDLPAELFDELDKSKDGELDALEVLKLLRRPADLELALGLGGEKAGPPLSLLRASLPPGVPPPRSDGRALVLVLGDVEMDIRRAEGGMDPTGGAQADQLRAAYLQRFKMADADNKGFVSKDDLKKPEYRNILNLFDLLDRDGDGRVTDEEFEGYFNVQARLVRHFATLTTAEAGRDLFGLLDTNRDGSLGPRELRSAWAALSRHDRAGRGAVSLDDVPRQVSLLVAPGAGMRVPAAVASGVVVQPSTPPPAARGPLWFRKMDRNGDGDVSLKEFLGPIDVFKTLDADGDGLISADEAERSGASRR